MSGELLEREDRSPSVRSPLESQMRTDGSAVPDEPEILHVTDRLMNQPGVREALRQYQQALERSTPLGKRAAVDYQVGDTARFNVYRSDTTAYRTDVLFEVRKTSSNFNLWVEVAEMDGVNGDPPHVRPEDVENLFESLAQTTPEDSYDPGAGIIANTEAVFGEPGDLDGNGKAHLLLTDVKDGWDGSGSYVAGFFNPVDLNFSNSRSNQGEFLYLDTYPGIYSGSSYNVSETLQSTAAHEYQHLIHATYDASELTFVNEGLSEWAEVVNGYEPRTIGYLSSSKSSTGYNQYLFDWTRPNSSETLIDYQRAGLLTHYLAERLGTMATGRITRIQKHGAAGYEAAFDSAGQANWTFPEVLEWFHLANLLNDRTVDPRYGYDAGSRASIDASPDPVFEGRTDSTTGDRTLEVSPGAVRYVQWKNVNDLSITLKADTSSEDEVSVAKAAANGPTAEEIASWIDARLILRADGAVTVDTTIQVGSESKVFAGSHDQATLVLVHREAQQSQLGDGSAAEAASLAYSAEWGSGESYSPNSIAYDNNQILRDTSDQLIVTHTGIEPDAMQAVKFPVPEGGDVILSEVKLPLYFRSQLGGDESPPDDALRDFSLHIWRNSAESLPGEELHRLVLEDTRSYRPVYTSDTMIRRLTVNLDSLQGKLPSFGDTLWIGVSEQDTDDYNHLRIVPSPYRSGFDGTNVSVIDLDADSISWTPLEDLSVGGTSLEGSTLAFRIEFLVSTANAEITAEIGEIPEEFELGANYPNPFNPTTQIPYRLPARSEVDLTVYDALGRRVATLVEGEQPPGRYTVSVHAGSWPSGLYLYVLRADGRIRTGKMLLLK